MNAKRTMPGMLILGVLAGSSLAAAEPARREILPAISGGKDVPAEVMKNIYREVRTPHKYGVILKAEGTDACVDAPQIFRHADKWYMMYITINSGCPGYETMLAVSDDLLAWKPLGKILPFRKDAWDCMQAAGYFALQDTAWDGSYELGTHDGKYWLCYFGGNRKGYEPDPLMIGMAWTTDPTRPEPWTRLDAPVLSGDQPDSRYWEKLTLFQGYILHDQARSLGFPYVMYYNARSNHDSYERIGMALSQDMRTWLRYGRDPVIDHGRGLAGAAQVVRIGDVWVMFYFGAFYKPGAFDTFACSYDLVHWTKWTGPNLVEPSEPWDKTYAHKPWMVKYKGVAYHFYCAVGDQGRVIALATSGELPPQPAVKSVPAGESCKTPR